MNQSFSWYQFSIPFLKRLPNKLPVGCVCGVTMEYRRNTEYTKCLACSTYHKVAQALVWKKAKNKWQFPLIWYSLYLVHPNKKLKISQSQVQYWTGMPGSPTARVWSAHLWAREPQRWQSQPVRGWALSRQTGMGLCTQGKMLSCQRLKKVENKHW